MKDGGPAFPKAACVSESGSIRDHSNDGMTLLDYFAGQAIVGLLAGPHLEDAIFNEIARDAYQLSAAMLVERQIRMEDE